MATNLPVKDYLDSLTDFLTGDLMVLHNASNIAETKETTLGLIPGQTADTQSAASQPTVSSTTTPMSSSYPGPQSSNPQPTLYRATIPLTLALFATMDILGFLWGTNSPGQQNTKNLEEFVNRISLDQDQKDALIKIYRHGMVHGFFPKMGLAISYHSNDPKGELFFGRNGNIVLNVDELEKLVLTQLGSIPPSDLPAMEVQYQRMVQDYKTKSSSVIANLGAKIKHY